SNTSRRRMALISPINELTSRAWVDRHCASSRATSRGAARVCCFSHTAAPAPAPVATSTAANRVTPRSRPVRATAPYQIAAHSAPPPAPPADADAEQEHLDPVAQGRVRLAAAEIGVGQGGAQPEQGEGDDRGERERAADNGQAHAQARLGRRPARAVIVV